MADALPLLDVRDLTVEFQTRRGIVRAVEHVDISIGKGETVGIVGESGSGKSVTSYAVMRILLGQILPNIMPIMMVQMSLTMGYAILNAAGLSFIGLGVRPPTAEWGIMVAEGAAFMVSGEWWIAFFPGAALMIAVFCFNLLGDGLRDIIDPQRRT